MSNALPIIDVSSFAAGAPRTAESDAVAESIDRACRETGFLLIAGHGIAHDTRSAMFEQMARFFSLLQVKFMTKKIILEIMSFLRVLSYEC